MPTNAIAMSRAPRSALGRLRRGVPVAATPPPPALARSRVGQQHGIARFSVGALERAPPRLEIRRYLAARRAQGEKVVRHAKARMLEQAVGARARAALEARLHRPYFAHGRGELAGDGELLALHVEHLVHC